jgi:hypothetical protein
MKIGAADLHCITTISECGFDQENGRPHLALIRTFTMEIFHPDLI